MGKHYITPKWERLKEKAGGSMFDHTLAVWAWEQLPDTGPTIDQLYEIFRARMLTEMAQTVASKRKKKSTGGGR